MSFLLPYLYVFDFTYLNTDMFESEIWLHFSKYYYFFICMTDAQLTTYNHGQGRLLNQISIYKFHSFQ